MTEEKEEKKMTKEEKAAYDAKMKEIRLMEMDPYIKIFVYGTLQDPKLIKELDLQLITMEPAQLKGFHSYCRKEFPYPVAKPKEEGNINGTVFTAKKASLAAIDGFYEVRGEFFMRSIVPITLTDSGREVKAFTYEQGPEIEDEELTGEWKSPVYSY